MVRFSCFSTHSHSHKPKKTFQQHLEAMQKTFEDCPRNQAPNDFTVPSDLITMHVKDHDDTLSDSNNLFVVSSPAVENGWKSEQINNRSNSGSDVGLHQNGQHKKSRSLGDELEVTMVSGSTGTEDEVDRAYSCDDAHDSKGLVVPGGMRDQETGILGRYEEAFPAESPQASYSDMENNGSVFLIDDPQNIEKEGHEYPDIHLSSNRNDISAEITYHTVPLMVKSCSMPNIRASTPTPDSFREMGPRTRSSEDLHALEKRDEDSLFHDVGALVIHDQGKDGLTNNAEKSNLNTITEVGFETYNYAGTAKDWIIPVRDEVNTLKNLKGELSEDQWNGSPSMDSKIKRVEEWVVNLQQCCHLEETDEPLHHPQEVCRGPNFDGLAAIKPDTKPNPSMEVAKKYISSLSVTASTAQLANHGLVVVPFLSAFASLKVLNLSGNAIVRVTAGALPRGLHFLNLSKNNISTIEGLRELNRLRILDLSYNRITRIGHGLASCSSLKELYLAGNKISEVEGLHRLLKLNVLDLRFNKISTAKCLGQLAANYNSLQAISLEGNPAQKNVGDEQLRKQLQGLLPHLAYYNRQPIKVGKDAADRLARLGTSHQVDRGLRSEHRSLRKSTHGAAAHKASTSTHARKSQAVISPRRIKARHGRLPPAGTASTTHLQQPYYDFGSKIASTVPNLSMHRSRSEGTLRAI